MEKPDKKDFICVDNVAHVDIKTRVTNKN